MASREIEDKPILFEPGKIPLSAFPHRDVLTPCIDDIPRFLFRVTGPWSAGTTSTKEVCSRAWLNNPSENCKDLFAYDKDFSPSLIAQKLEDHLLCMHKFDSNLVSWTSSLLFALHYAVYRFYMKGSLEDLSLLVVDTTQFPKGAFIRDLEAIDAFKSYSTIPSDVDGLQRLYGWRSTNAYFGETLSQGRLPLNPEFCSSVSLKELRDRGLVRLNPAIWYRDLPATWCGAVLVLRAELRSSSRRMLDSDVSRAIALAKSFPNRRFHVPMAFMFLSLCPRQIDEEVALLFSKVLLQPDEFTSGLAPEPFKLVYS
ncbi:uncharacterized protein CTRU02_203951 [Colletotrichum truncatum]|uniref:Uncharacterized protein n=1 Tax=Colletotrichum truncatum TaxID=5467 RepID=A0ACC3ZAK7_COLTU|nr:uncharacterized protein CTRU02_15432 [Colletotrichum truncatum]KAF6781031.1 hypothetical protein CTRU02_15432 [Colletotrichum truncatum]